MRRASTVLAAALVAAVPLSALFVASPAGAAGAATDTTPVDAVRLTTTYPALSVEPGSTVKLDLDARAPVTERVDLAVPVLPDGWTATLRGGGFVISGLTAAPTGGAPAQLELRVPANAAPGAYPVEVDETAPQGASKLALTIDVQATVDSGVELTADFPSLTGGPTDTFSYTLTITNNTPASATFNFAGNGPTGWTVTASPEAQSRANTVTIDGGGTAKVTVSASPPAEVTAGKYPIDVTVTGANGASGKIELTAEVTGTAKLALATADQRLNLGGPAAGTRSETLVVSNSGTKDLSGVTFNATPPTGWTVTFTPTKLDDVPAGQSAQVTATIKPAKDALVGDYAIGITASSGKDSANVALRYSVSTSHTWWIVGLVVILLALGAIYGVFRRLGRR